MRLLNIDSLEFREFNDPKHIPPYLIASHRWGADETTYKDVRKCRNTDADGYKKVEKFCEFIRRMNEKTSPRQQGLLDIERKCEWLWIDTACINKADSAEVSKSINLMFKWYSAAQICYAHLSDVGGTIENAMLDFYKSEWFKRGWTLQELLAPRIVVFISKEWTVLGHKCPYARCDAVCKGLGPKFNPRIAAITGIPAEVLRNGTLSNRYTVAVKKRWALERQTTEEEDGAYCMLGLFDVHMPLNYGEGGEAWTRLEEAIAKSKQQEQVSEYLVLNEAMTESRRRSSMDLIVHVPELDITIDEKLQPMLQRDTQSLPICERLRRQYIYG